MRRLYVVSKAAWNSHALDSEGNPMQAGESPLSHLDLFDPRVGSHYIELDDEHILVSTAFGDEWSEETWHGHPEVARLPHPVHEGHIPIKDVVHDPEHGHYAEQHSPKQVKHKHLKALREHPDLALSDTDTVLHLAKKAQKLHPQVKLNRL